MSFPLVQELAAEGIPVRLTCGVLGFSPQAFYKWRARPCSTRDLDDIRDYIAPLSDQVETTFGAGVSADLNEVLQTGP